MIAINTLKHLAYLLKVDPKELQVLIQDNRIGLNYSEQRHIKYKKNGEPQTNKDGLMRERIINPSHGRLKVIQKRLQKNILQKIVLPSYTFGGVKKRDNVMNAELHKGKKYKFITDLRSFFPSVSNKMVYDMFVGQGCSHDVAKCLTRLTTFKGHLPQGVSTSSTIANLTFLKTGNRLKEFAELNGLIFSIFVDDLTMSSSSDFKELTPLIIDIIQQGGYIISHNKTVYKAGNLVITGAYCTNNSLELTKSFNEKVNNINSYSEQQKKGILQYASKVAKANTKKQ